MSTEITNRILTLPNLISLIRLLLVPVFAVTLVVYQNNIAAFVLFLVAASTDFLDGAIARSMGQVSRLGQQLDPLVDRILILTGVIAVYIVGRVPLWILLLIFARDLSMLVLLAQLRATGQPKFEVAYIGKAATAIIMAGFCLLILNWPEVGGLGLIDSAYLPGWGSTPAPLGMWLVYCGVVLAWAAGIYYMIRAYEKSKRPQSESSNLTKRRTKGAYDEQAQRGESAQTFHEGYVYNPGQRPANTRAPRQDAGTRQRRTGNSSSAKSQTSYSGKVRSSMQERGTASGVRVFLNTPQKMLIAIAIMVFMVVALVFYGFDIVRNYGVIHSGVKVGTVDVSSMGEAEAATLLTTELTAEAALAPVNLFADEEALQEGVSDATQQLGNGVVAYNQAETEQSVSSWSVDLATFDAEVNGSELAQEAYGIGRNGDFLFGRLAAQAFGVTITPQVDLSADRLHSIEGMLTKAIGIPMENANITFDGHTFTVVDGQDGIVVDEEQFEQALQTAFFSEDRDFVVPLVERDMQVTREDAQEVAEATQLAITDPITVNYGEDSWTLTTEQLGQYISTAVEKDESGTVKLVASIDAQLLASLLPEVIGHIEDQIAPLNAEFVVVEGELQVIPSQNGTGVDYARLADDMNAILFEKPTEEADQSRDVPLNIGILEPELKTSDAEAYDFSTKISEYTIEYWWVGQGTITNIHVASDLINSSLIAPNAIWSFNETAGECTADKGFVEAQVILGDEYVDDIGGGVCNVASTVFNAAYEAGYPIVERTNHSLRLARYPLGRDAAIAYPYIDLKFKNDTENYVLLTMSYTDSSVTCTLWGISPGYTVESVAGELVEGADFVKKEIVDEDLAPGQKYVEQEGKKASKVEVTRTVYYADGTLKEQRTFYSSYDATPEIVKVGSEP